MMGRRRFRVLTISLGLALLVGCKDKGLKVTDWQPSPAEPGRMVNKHRSVWGVVATGAPVAGARVTGYDSLGNTFETTTDETGYFQFEHGVEESDEPYRVAVRVEVDEGEDLLGAVEGLLDVTEYQNGEREQRNSIELNVNPIPNAIMRAACGLEEWAVAERFSSPVQATQNACKAQSPWLFPTPTVVECTKLPGLSFHKPLALNLS